MPHVNASSARRRVHTHYGPTPNGALAGGPSPDGALTGGPSPNGALAMMAAWHVHARHGM